MARLFSIVLAAAALVSAAPAAHADPGTAGPTEVPPAEMPTLAGPVQVDHGQAITYAKRHPGSAPAGVNNVDCKPGDAHPHPVVLVHGTDSNAYSDWAGIAPSLVRDGYCVYALNYGGRPGGTDFGTEDMNIGVRQLSGFVDRVLATTGASKVDLVGFSQGATIARAYINRLGGARYVHRWIGLASPSYGGDFYGLVPIIRTVPLFTRIAQFLTSIAVIQQMQGSSFLAALNAGGDTVPGVRYTTIGSRVDEMIQPYTNVALRSPGATNIVIQDVCPSDLTGHFNMPYDRFAQQLVLNALDPGTPRPPTCELVPLGAGILSVIIAAHS